MLTAIIMSFVLALTTFAIHYFCLSFLQRRLPKRLLVGDHWLLLVVVTVLFCVHMVEIGTYAGAYYAAVNHLDIGSFLGLPVDGYMTYFYYSGVVYTSLGFGDIYPDGHIRFISQVEALNGLMLITWSASFTYLVMRRVW